MKPVRIRNSESLDQAVTRISAFLHDEFCRQLSYRSNVHESIHNARLCIKRQRALLRLIRPSIREEIYLSTNRFYRDLSLNIAFLRDFSACLDAISGLQENRRSSYLDQRLTRLHRRIFHLRAEALAATDTDSLFPALSEEMKKAGESFCQWDLSGLSGEVVYQGIRKLYVQGKRRLDQALLDPGETTFHQLRKSLKYLFYVNQMLEELWPALVSPQLTEYKSFTSLLGEHHDLYILDQHFDSMIPPKANREYRSRLRQAIWKKKRKLEIQILQGGQRIYAEKPTGYAHRFKTWWLLAHPT